MKLVLAAVATLMFVSIIFSSQKSSVSQKAYASYGSSGGEVVSGGSNGYVAPVTTVYGGSSGNAVSGGSSGSGVSGGSSGYSSRPLRGTPILDAAKARRLERQSHRKDALLNYFGSRTYGSSGS